MSSELNMIEMSVQMNSKETKEDKSLIYNSKKGNKENIDKSFFKKNSKLSIYSCMRNQQNLCSEKFTVGREQKNITTQISHKFSNQSKLDSSLITSNGIITENGNNLIGNKVYDKLYKINKNSISSKILNNKNKNISKKNKEIQKKASKFFSKDKKTKIEEINCRIDGDKSLNIYSKSFCMNGNENNINVNNSKRFNKVNSNSQAFTHKYIRISSEGNLSKNQLFNDSFSCNDKSQNKSGSHGTETLNNTGHFNNESNDNLSYPNNDINNAIQNNLFELDNHINITSSDFESHATFNNEMQNKNNSRSKEMQNPNIDKIKFNNEKYIINSSPKHEKEKNINYKDISRDASHKKFNINSKKVNNNNQGENQTRNKSIKHKIDFQLMLERFRKREQKITQKMENLKKKLEEEEIKNSTQNPQINKNGKYYNINYDSFFKRLEQYKHLKEAKISYLLDREEKRLAKNFNQSLFKNKKKMRLEEIQLIINEKFEKEKQRKLQKEAKIKQIALEKEESLLLECTFKPEISQKSSKMDLSNIRSKYDLNKTSSMQKLLEYNFSKKYYNIVRAANICHTYSDTNKSINNNQSDVSIDNNTTLIKNKSTNISLNNEFKDKSKNSKAKIHNLFKAERISGKELSKKDEKSHLAMDTCKINNRQIYKYTESSNDSDHDIVSRIGENNTKQKYYSKSAQKENINQKINISKKEVELMLELLNKQFI